MKFLIAGATVSLLMVPIAAGASSTPNAKGPKLGGTLNMVIAGQVTSFDPAITEMTNTYDGPEMNMVYGYLCTFKPQTGALVYDEAESLIPANGGKVWTLTIHPHMKFSDGTPFNAAAVASNIQRNTNPAIGSLNASLAASFTTKVVNATTLQMTLATPSHNFNVFFCNAFTIVGSPAAEAAEPFPSYGLAPVGAGPFKLVTWNQNTSMTFTKNPYYTDFQKGQPYLNGINLTILPSISQQEAALETHADQLGVFNTGSASMGVLLRPMGFTVQKFIIGGAGLWDFNNSAPPFNNLDARLCVYYAIPRPQDANTSNPGAPVAKNWFAPTSPFYNPKNDFPAADPAKAQQYCNAYTQQTGKPLNFAMLTSAGSAQNQINAAYVLSQLAAYPNVHATVTPQPQNLYLADDKTHNYQMSIAGTFAPNPIPTYIELFTTGGSGNYEAWSDPIIDKALNAVVKVKSVQAQKAYWNTFTAEFNKQIPMIPKNVDVYENIFWPGSLAGVSGGVDLGTTLPWGQISLTNP